MPGAVVIGLFYTYFTPIQAVTIVEGQTDCCDTLYCPTRSNSQRADFFAFAVKVNSYGSSVLHYIEARLVQMNFSLHGPFKFNTFYQKHKLASTKIKGTHKCLAYYRSDQRQPKRNLQRKATNRG
jgi:hypothetical protein